jgi:tetratricopeptide (TPR) repeat protein
MERRPRPHGEALPVKLLVVADFRRASPTNHARSCRVLLLLLAALLNPTMQPAMALGVLQQPEARVEGVARDSQGKPVSGASVLLLADGQTSSARTQTKADGTFTFLSVRAGTYRVKLEKSGFHDAVEDSIRLATGETKHCEFVLRTLAESSASPAGTGTASSGIELDDRPNFTVAGITDSTGSGGHGSETRLRTGEGLARETMNLESGKSKEAPVAAPEAGGIDPEARASEGVLRAAVQQDPRSFEANHRLGEFYLYLQRYRESISPLAAAYQLKPGDHQNAFDLALAYKAGGEFMQAREHVDQMLVQEKNLSNEDEARLRRLLGDLDETLGDPLGSVKEHERAASLDGSEANYFAWGAELLLHRAAVPAIEVFSKGIRAHPDSARMLAGLGAALYTSGSAGDAARRLCQASDLEPANPAPYLFLGKMQEATSTPLACAQQKLDRFLHNQPENPLANYYYALALWKRNRGALGSGALQQAETLLRKATALDPNLDAAYLALGNLYFARGNLQAAVGSYQKAIAANPSSDESHYRLGLAYKKTGDEAKAQHEFEEYKELDKVEADTIERQRRELRQFVFVLKDQAVVPRSTSDPSLSK